MKDYIKDGVRYISFRVSCPTCVEKNSPVSNTYWTHFDDNCGGDMLLGDNGYILCDKCGQHQILSKCRFLCPYHIEGITKEMISFDHSLDFPAFHILTFCYEFFRQTFDAHSSYVNKLIHSLDDMLNENKV